MSAATTGRRRVRATGDPAPDRCPRRRRRGDRGTRPDHRRQQLPRPGHLGGRHPARAASARNAFNVEGDRGDRRRPLRLVRHQPRMADRRRRRRRQRRPPRARQSLRPDRPRRSARRTSPTPKNRPSTRAGRWPRSSTTSPPAPTRLRDRLPERIRVRRKHQRLAAPPAAGGVEAEVLVDDIAYFEEPFFQDGPIGAAIEDVTGAGVAYFSAAGNDNLSDDEGNDIASWETPSYRDTACPPELETLGPFKECLDFDPEEGGEDPTFGITVEPEETLNVDLQWAEPRFGVESDLDAFLLDDEDKVADRRRRQRKNLRRQRRQQRRRRLRKHRAAGRVLRLGKRPPKKSVEVRLVVNRCFGTCNPGADIRRRNRGSSSPCWRTAAAISETEYPKSAKATSVGPTIYGHAGTPAAISVGAVPFNNSNVVEPYSSHGPRHPLLRDGENRACRGAARPSRSRSRSPIWWRPTAA